jgi:ADP-heptose:LPS heptosyltransferase
VFGPREDRRRWDVEDYAAVFRAMLANQGKYTHVLLSSDDPAVYQQMATALEHREVRGHTQTHTQSVSEREKMRELALRGSHPFARG